jgi:ATP-dependent RNA helicase DeaD
MTLSEHAELLGPDLLAAIEQKGYTELTPVQRVVLDPTLAGSDLRITSQTGSGKTIAIGLTLRKILQPMAAVPGAPAAKNGVARPRALVVAPTRELALQVQQELTWLFAPSRLSVASTTGGASYRAEQRSLGQGPAIVVGTPGRLLDHLRRGSIDAGQVAAIVLDEADRMLDLGFREDLEAIMEQLPAERSTHLVSATFSRALSRMADRMQRDPRHVEGSALGVANTDIDHVIYIVDAFERFDALVNLLLAPRDDQTLVFVRTRADASQLASQLAELGFAASALSGEMDQNARNRALAAFRSGTLRVLVATDVAARGIDVQSVARVVHAEQPKDPDTYTHRSGRTGRAGRKGVSALLVPPVGVVQATRLLRALSIPHRVEPVPTPAQIRAAEDERIVSTLTAAESETPVDPRFVALAERLVQDGHAEQSLARLLAQQSGGIEPRQVRVHVARPQRMAADDGDGRRGRGPRDRERGRTRERLGNDSRERFGNAAPARREPAVARSTGDADSGPRRVRDADTGAPRQQERTSPRQPRESASNGASETNGAARSERGAESDHGSAAEPGSGFTEFRVTWGSQRGADARRLLAMLCRRGRIRGVDVGAIRVNTTFSVVGVADAVADSFERLAAIPDPREPFVKIRRDGGPSQPSAAGETVPTRRAPAAAASAGATSRRPRPRRPTR